ncbi:MAG: MbcA/ParS/Xre antitoxin family protein [Gammaproteobacteria bacterium]|nr:MbcA/ParS/Xre antitoxin family protein [Gammaproteobacteria bacterium]
MSAANHVPSLEQQIIRTQKVMHALDEWGLSGEQILAVLDLPEEERSRHLAKYRKDTPFPDDAKVACRVKFLLGIIDALRTTYPRNLQMGARWMTAPHVRLNNRCPLQAMLEDGETGVVAVLSELDCAYAWELSGSKMN